MCETASEIKEKNDKEWNIPGKKKDRSQMSNPNNTQTVFFTNKTGMINVMCILLTTSNAPGVHHNSKAVQMSQSGNGERFSV